MISEDVAPFHARCQWPFHDLMVHICNPLPAKLAERGAIQIGITIVKSAAVVRRIGPIVVMLVHGASAVFGSLCGANVYRSCPLRGGATAAESAQARYEQQERHGSSVDIVSFRAQVVTVFTDISDVDSACQHDGA